MSKTDTDKKPLVSIVTPCYNHERFLDDYFDSILAQTYENIELIMLDDHSTDGSWEKIRSYKSAFEKKLTRMVLKRNPENRGLLRTMALLKDEVGGDYVTILESDDYLKPEKISRNIAFLEEHADYGAVHSDVDFLFMEGNRRQPNHWQAIGKKVPEGDIFEDLLNENLIFSCAFCCRRSLFEEFADYERLAEKAYFAADYPFFLELSRHCKIGYVDEALAVYRVVEDSISHPRNPRKAFEWKRDYYRVKLDCIDAYGASEDVRQRAMRQYFRAHYWFGYNNYCQEEFHKGHSWLSERYPKEFGTFSHRFRALSMKNKVLWHVVSKLDRATT